MTTHLSALIAPLNTNNSDNTNIFLAHGGAERNFDFWMLNVELLRLAAMWNWPMMNFDALTRCFEHEIFEHGCHSVFFEHEIRRRPTDRREVITRMTRIFFGTRISPISRIFVRGGRSHGEHEIFEHGCHSVFFWTRDSPKAHWPQGGNNADNTNIICTRISLTLQLSFYLLQESLGDVAGGDGT